MVRKFHHRQELNAILPRRHFLFSLPAVTLGNILILLVYRLTYNGDVVRQTPMRVNLSDACGMPPKGH